jgi:hypothetical protein
MRAAILLSVLTAICAVAAGFGYSAVYVAGQSIVGVKGLAFGLAMAIVPPVAVLVWRRASRPRRPLRQ